jgi:hypothetical protein
MYYYSICSVLFESFYKLYPVCTVCTTSILSCLKFLNYYTYIKEQYHEIYYSFVFLFKKKYNISRDTVPLYNSAKV